MVVATLGSKNCAHKAAMMENTITIDVVRLSCKASIPAAVITTPRIRSIPTMTCLRFSLSVMDPVNGERNIAMKLEILDNSPSRVFEPVFSYTQ